MALQTPEEFAERLDFSAKTLNSDTATRAEMIRDRDKAVALAVLDALETAPYAVSPVARLELRRRIESGEWTQ